MAVLILGAAGAVGKRLCAALSKRGDRVIAADRMPRLPAKLTSIVGAVEPGVDVRDDKALHEVFAVRIPRRPPIGPALPPIPLTHVTPRVRQRHSDIEAVWNLAAPLSVETAMDPAIAEAVTVGGMRSVVGAMRAHGVRKILFTDSIGSFGAAAPRNQCAARWLTENPTQDPGSDYGRQKRGCREVLKEFAANGNGDPRWAVLPGVLHAEPVWGNGTTEYALEALKTAAMGSAERPATYACPVEPNTTLPMIWVDDLMRGLLALQDAPEESLHEPERGYAIPGLSFSANQLFEEIQGRRAGRAFSTTMALDDNMAAFAKLWPDTLCEEAPNRDLGYSPETDLPQARSRHDLGDISATSRRAISARACSTHIPEYISPGEHPVHVSADGDERARRPRGAPELALDEVPLRAEFDGRAGHAVEVPRYSRDMAEIQPRCGRDAAEISQRYG